MARKHKANILSVATASVAILGASQAIAQVAGLTKGQSLSVKYGLQLQALSTNFDPWDLATVQNANYSAVNWLWDSNVGAQGNLPWARWVRPPGTYDGTFYPDGQIPPRDANEAAKMGSLIALSLGDEPDLNNDTVRQSYIDWFNRLQNSGSFSNQILYMNNYGGQVGDAALGDFIARGHPDMISWDTYPYRYAAGGNPTRVQPVGGSPINWYSDFRRYREHAKGNNIPLGVYRQTYHSLDEGVRDPSESELRLQTFAALAFNAKYITDFTYNSGASPMFGYTGTGTNTFYGYVKEANRQAKNLGPAMVRLKPVADWGVGHTTSMMFVRGKHDIGGGSSAFNDIPGYSGFIPDPSSQAYTDWNFGSNDPYLSGGFPNGATNLGTKNSGLPGDVIVSWFQPLDEWFDGDDFSNEKYIMVVNGLADMDGTAADCRQTITLDFQNVAGAQVLQTLDPNTGVISDVSLPLISTKRRYTLTLDGGSSMLFKFKDGAPFVGTLPPDAIWKTGTTGSFATPGNWDINAAPSGNYFLHFGTIAGAAGPAYTSTLSGALTVKGAFVHNDNVTWNLGASTLTLSGFSGVDSLVVGMRAGENGSLTLSNGTLVVPANAGFYSQIGKAAGAVGTMIVGNGANWINSTDLLIGKLGNGTLIFNPGSTASLTNVYVGGGTLASGGTGNFNMTGGSVSLTKLKIWATGTATMSGGTLGAGSIDMTGGNFTRTNGSLSFGSFTQTGGTASLGNVSTTGSITVGGGASLAQMTLGQASIGSLAINALGKVIVNNAGLVAPTRVPSLTISGGAVPTGTLDLNAAMIVDYTGTSPLSTLRTQIIKGYASGSFTGAGITSASAATIAASATIHKTAVGYAEASALGVGSFLGQSVDTSALLMRYTFVGDANLDGQVNGNDFTRLAQHFNQPNANWADGDANFDGAVNALDFNALATNFGQILPAPPLGSLVPEPAIVLLPFAVLLRRRHPM